MKLIGTAIGQKPTGEDGSHRVGCRTAISRIAMAKATFNKEILFARKLGSNLRKKLLKR
jgi:hypothetical protein